jgi:hypothetical protein
MEPAKRKLTPRGLRLAGMRGLVAGPFQPHFKFCEKIHIIAIVAALIGVQSFYKPQLYLL